LHIVVGMKLALATSMTSLVVAFTACTEEPHLSSNRGKSFEEFKASVYREPGEHGVYVISGDVPVANDAELFKIWQATEGGALSVYTEGGADVVWNATQKKQLTYCVSTAFGANKTTIETALNEATKNGWEKMANVKFIHVTAQDANCNAANPNVMFDVNPVNSGGQYLARAFFPNFTRDQRNVLVDNTAFTGGAGNWPLKNVLGHELGHVLGFRHEHIRPEANAGQCAEDNQFRALTPYDAASVMHYPQCNGTSTDLSFTARDKTGVEALYGAPVVNVAPMAQINAPMEGATVGADFDVTTQIVDENLKDVELLIDGNSVTVKTTGPFTFPVTGLAKGAHTIDINATDSEGLVTSRSVSITVGNTGGGGGGGNSLTDNEIQGGCATGQTSAPWTGVVLLGFVVGLLRRRR